MSQMLLLPGAHDGPGAERKLNFGDPKEVWGGNGGSDLTSLLICLGFVFKERDRERMKERGDRQGD